MFNLFILQNQTKVALVLQAQQTVTLKYKVLAMVILIFKFMVPVAAQRKVTMYKDLVQGHTTSKDQRMDIVIQLFKAPTMVIQGLRNLFNIMIPVVSESIAFYLHIYT